jgi:hypothetical protein
MAKERKPDELTEEELARATGEPLPDREAMSVIPGVVIGGGVIPVDSDPDVIPIDDPQPKSE